MQVLINLSSSQDYLSSYFLTPSRSPHIDVIVESNYLKPSTYQDKSGIEPLHYSKVYSPDNHICNDDSCEGNLPENPQALCRKQHSDIIGAISKNRTWFFGVTIRGSTIWTKTTLDIISKLLWWSELKRHCK